MTRAVILTPTPAPVPPATLAGALVALQGKLPRIHKGETARVSSDKGGYSYTYADLADVSARLLPVLSEVGLAFTARPTLVDGQMMLVYALVHTSGEREEGVYPLPTVGNPQAMGSAITYARRYCLLAVTGAHPDGDDDDAQSAMPNRGGGRQQAPPTRTPAEVDHEFVEQARTRIDAATTLRALRGVWHTISGALEQGRIDQAGANALAERMKARSAELVDEPVEAPLHPEPVPEPVPGPDRGPSPWDEPPRPEPAPAPPAEPAHAPAPASVVPEPTREEKLAALRARARRIADNHREDTPTDDN